MRLHNQEGIYFVMSGVLVIYTIDQSSRIILFVNCRKKRLWSGRPGSVAFWERVYQPSFDILVIFSLGEENCIEGVGRWMSICAMF